MESLFIHRPTEEQWDTIQKVADYFGMICYGNYEKNPTYVYNIEGDIFTGEKRPDFGRKVSFDEFIALTKGEDYVAPRPVCMCGSELIVVRYEGYYDSFNTWKCPDEDCRLLEYMEPVHTSKGSYT